MELERRAGRALKAAVSRVAELDVTRLRRGHGARAAEEADRLAGAIIAEELHLVGLAIVERHAPTARAAEPDGEGGR